MTLESEISAFLQAKASSWTDNTSSVHELDYSYVSPSGFTFHVDAKEKRSHVALSLWPQTGVPERDLFILDDLALRKVLAAGHNSGVIVADRLENRYVFLSQFDLAYMRKYRANRMLETGSLKGKCLVDLSDGASCSTLAEAFAAIYRYMTSAELFASAAYRRYRGEQITSAGSVRSRAYMRSDFASTR